MVEIAFLLKKSPWIAVAVHVLRGVWAVKSQNKFRVGGVEPPRVFVAFKSHRSPLSGSFFRGIRRVSHWERELERVTLLHQHLQSLNLRVDGEPRPLPLSRSPVLFQVDFRWNPRDFSEQIFTSPPSFTINLPSNTWSLSFSPQF